MLCGALEDVLRLLMASKLEITSKGALSLFLVLASSSENGTTAITTGLKDIYLSPSEAASEGSSLFGSCLFFQPAFSGFRLET